MTPIQIRKDPGAQRAHPPVREVCCRTGAWHLLSLLGEGTYTSVYRARPAHCGDDRPADYAVKLLRDQFHDDAQVVELMLREAILGGRLSHPHLVAVLDAQLDRPPFHLVMPLIEGLTLRDWIARFGPLSVPNALWVARQTAEALGALHAEGWLHGDVKPANVLISASGHVTLLDLGFARRIEQPGSFADRPLTATFQYMAPELLTSSLRADATSDLYSLGVTLYHALCGRLPFESDSLEELATAHREQTPPPLRRIRPQIPHRVAWLVRDLLAKSPLRRPPSAEHLVRRLVSLEVESFDDRLLACA